MPTPTFRKPQKTVVCPYLSCTNLAYGSQFEQPYDRLLRSARRIRQRLGGGINLLEAVPAKPTGMHWQTYTRLVKREGDIWVSLKPELRLTPKGQCRDPGDVTQGV